MLLMLEELWLKEQVILGCWSSVEQLFVTENISSSKSIYMKVWKSYFGSIMSWNFQWKWVKGWVKAC